jgi:hypothetical protein
LKHIQGQKKLTADLTDGKENESVTILIDVLEEVKYVDRLAATGMKSIPLNEVVDASQPESMTARKFENWIAEFLADKTHQKNEKEIRLLLIKWKDNHSTFQMVANGNKRLEKVLLTSQELSAMSAQALKALDGLTGKISVKPEEKEEMQKIINQTAPSREGVLIAVTGALKKLVDSIR